MRRRRSSQPRLASELIDSWPFQGRLRVDSARWSWTPLRSRSRSRIRIRTAVLCRWRAALAVGIAAFFFLRSLRLLENSRHAFRWSGLSPISPQTSQPSVMSLAAVASISSTQSGQASASQKLMRSSSCLRPRIQ